MNRALLPLFLFGAIFCAPPNVVATNTIIYAVAVGNPGNANDSTGFGGVTYAYRIGTYEVTNAQYAAFLTEKAKSDPLGLYNASMASDPRGGITQGGTEGNFTYATKPNMDNKPVNYVSWYDSIRFANWLNNGQGGGDTETGAYTILGGTATPIYPTSIKRNAGAIWFLPSESEWYKAAFHQPSAQGGDGDNYWLYPTKSNTAPAIALADSVGNITNPGANIANFNRGAQWNSQNGNVTTVGSAGPLSHSFYGTADQAASLWEWSESLIGNSGRGTRGGDFGEVFNAMQASFRGAGDSTAETVAIGFRVAAVIPEPSTGVMAGIGIGLLGLLRKRFKKAQ